ncbi:MAG: response regulator [Chloroflexales bacterium]|nr:response regulator [Chloroflexales bacterium]
MTDVLNGGGEIGARMREFNWGSTPFGTPDTWPQSLRSAVGICLNSRFPIAIYWGPQLALLYNDAWSPILGEKHPGALGRPGREVWPEIWAEIGPLFEAVQRTGEGVWQQDQLLPMHRHGYTEECYFNFTFSPIRGEDGSVVGIFNAVIETTFRIIEERRARILRDLSERTAGAQSAPEVCARAAEVLGANPADVPFCLFYLREHDAPLLQRVAAAGAALPEQLCPTTIDPADRASLWPVAAGHAPQAAVTVYLGERLGVTLPGGIWPEAVERALIMSIPSLQATEPAGLFIAGVSPRRAFDEAYHTFIERVTTQIVTAIGNARAYETERRRAEALAEIDRAKTAFFSNVSHEFRTPLTLLLGPLEDTLAQPDGLSAEAHERLEIVRRNALRLLKLVNTLLDFSRLEAGRAQASYEPTDLALFTTDLASVFRSTIERAGLRLIVTCPPLADPVYVDREMWEKIVFNLLSNAFKFTFEGEIEIVLQQAGAAVELAVRDTGIGIPAEELPHLFERFNRVKSAHGRSFEGSGIGLALVQELVKLHGGAVRVESYVSRGTTFTVSVPAGAAHLPADRIGVVSTLATGGLRGETYVEEALRWLPEGSSAMPSAGSAVMAEPMPSTRHLTREASSTSPAHILLVDDNADMREHVRRLLSQKYTVVGANDGAAALRLTREQPFDLVLTDVMMPRLDGFGLLAALRSDERTKTLPVILLSAQAGEESCIEGMEAGADDYLVKPFSARELLARVSAHVTMARLRRESSQRERELRAEAQAAREQLERVLASVSDQFLVLDHDWQYVFVNDRVTEVTGLRREDLLGRCIWELFPETVGTEIERKLRQAAAEQTPVHVEHFYARWNRWFEHHAYPSASGLTLYVADITERRQAEDKLRLVNERFRIAEGASNGFIYDWDVTSDRIERSDSFKKVLGYEQGEMPPTSAAWRALIHPEDRAPMRALFDALLAEGLPGCRSEYRIRHKNGAWVWVLDENAAIYREGKLWRLIGSTVNITEHKRRELNAGFLGDITADLALLTSDSEMMRRAGEKIANHLYLSRCLFCEVEQAVGQVTIFDEYREQDLPSLKAVHRAEDWVSEDFWQTLVAGHDVVIDDAAADPRTATGLESLKQVSVGSCIAAPCLIAGRLKFVLVVSHRQPYAWRTDELELIRELALRIWLSYDRARADRQLRAAQAYRLAEERQHAARLQQLNAASLAINAAPTRDDVLNLIADQARALIGANQAVVKLDLNGGWPQTQAAVSHPEPYAAWESYQAQLSGEGVERLVYNERHPLRLAQAESETRLAWRSFASQHSAPPPRNGVLTAPLTDSDGARIGVIQLSGKATGEFTVADEALLWQIAQMAAVALENQTLYEQEQAARAQAEEASRLKDEFLATVSHELRTPLTAMLAYAQLLQARKRDEAYIARTAEKLVRSAKDQALIIDDLLDVSGIVSGKLHIEPQPMDLIPVVHAALDTVRPAAEAKGLYLKVGLHPQACTIIGDANRLQQVVWNLLSNATKFTSPGGIIRVQLELDGRDALLTVSDTGQGIRPSFLPFVFDRFRQADSTSNRSHGGLGLGLAIVRHLVELHGGTIQAASAGEGQGATFTVRLPLSSGGPATSARHVAVESDTMADCPPELRGLRVLIVDDQPDILELLGDILASCGAVVRTCTGTWEALATLRSWRPDVLVSDIAMPGEDGYGLIRSIRALAPDDGGEIPAVALTAYVRAEERARVLAAGFQLYVPKPVEPAELRNVIAHLARLEALD